MSCDVICINDDLRGFHKIVAATGIQEWPVQSSRFDIDGPSCQVERVWGKATAAHFVVTRHGRWSAGIFSSVIWLNVVCHYHKSVLLCLAVIDQVQIERLRGLARLTNCCHSTLKYAKKKIKTRTSQQA